MRRQNTQAVGAVIVEFLRQQGLEKPFLEHKVVEAWPRLMGALVAKYTGKIEMKDGVLYVQIMSAALRQELFIARQKVVEKLNEEVGSEVVADIRLLG